MQFSKDNNAPIYTAGTVHSLKSMKVKTSASSLASTITCLKTSVRNRFPPPTSLKQLEDVPSGRMV
jgi:hypothetical protein